MSGGGVCVLDKKHADRMAHAIGKEARLVLCLAHSDDERAQSLLRLGAVVCTLCYGRAMRKVRKGFGERWRETAVSLFGEEEDKDDVVVVEVMKPPSSPSVMMGGRKMSLQEDLEVKPSRQNSMKQRKKGRKKSDVDDDDGDVVVKQVEEGDIEVEVRAPMVLCQSDVAMDWAARRVGGDLGRCLRDRRVMRGSYGRMGISVLSQGRMWGQDMDKEQMKMLAQKLVSRAEKKRREMRRRKRQNRGEEEEAMDEEEGYYISCNVVDDDDDNVDDDVVLVTADDSVIRVMLWAQGAFDPPVMIKACSMPATIEQVTQSVCRTLSVPNDVIVFADITTGVPFHADQTCPAILHGKFL